MATKPTGLAAFTQRNAPASPSEEVPVDKKDERRRGKGSSVALTVRVPRADWERLHALAISEGVSLQTIAIRGLSRIFADKGLPGIGDGG
jgi:hypothetical protein